MKSLRIQGRAAVVGLFMLMGCASAGASGRTPAQGASVAGGTAAGDPTLLALRWYRASAEVQALFLETYRAATSAVTKLAAAQTGGPWTVIMDADETVLDNSLYQQEQRGAPYSDSTWRMWVRSKRATALPGAVDFIRTVHTLGGKVVIVTNRDEVVCGETRDNLRQVGLVVDQVLCKPPETSDKNPRFAAVESGTPPSQLPAMKVLMWLGDNIQDFPATTQAIRAQGTPAFSKFGESWFVLPNPLYGSWERNQIP